MIRLLGLALLLVSVLSQANAPPPKQLKKLNVKINTVRSSLNKAQQQRQRLQQLLAQVETSSGHLRVRQRSTQHKIRQGQASLKGLESRAGTLNQQLNTQHQYLAQQLRAAYILGRQPYLKILLNPKNTHHLSRMLIYYHYLARNRLASIQTLEQTLSEITANQQRIEQQTSALKTLQTQLKTARVHLQRTKQKRRRLIRTLNRQIVSKHQKLSQLLKNKTALERMIAQIESRAQNNQTIQTHFAKLRGQLKWPTRGKIMHSFGTKIGQSELTWSGVLIRAPENRPVYAVANGKVVFAKWLAGYGLLLIINHGNGYMTLYGRNHYLYKKYGDQVLAGEQIATVGQSGGFAKPGLYFAIRHNAKPLNPLRWCKRRLRS